MIDLVATKYLVYAPSCERVFSRESAVLDQRRELGFTNMLGIIYDGPTLGMPEAVQSEWLDLLEWEMLRQETI